MTCLAATATTTSDFTILTVPDRLAAVGDLWAGILDSKSDLAGVLASGEDVTTS